MALSGLLVTERLTQHYLLLRCCGGFGMLYPCFALSASLLAALNFRANCAVGVIHVDCRMVQNPIATGNGVVIIVVAQHRYSFTNAFLRVEIFAFYQ